MGHGEAALAAFGLGRVMGDEQEGDGNRREDLPHFVLAGKIQGCGGLVGQEEPGAGLHLAKGPGYVGPLQFTPGELRERPVSQRPKPQAFSPCPRPGMGEELPQWKGNFSPRRALGDPGHGSGPGGRTGPGLLAAVHEDAAGMHRGKAQDGAQQGAFACTIAAKKGDVLARGKLQADRADGLLVPEAADEVTKDKMARIHVAPVPDSGLAGQRAR